MMNNMSAPAHQPVVGLKESGYQSWPCIHTDLWRAPVTFFWWASTPSGRQSRVYWYAFSFYRLMASGKLRKPKDGGELTMVYVPSAHYRTSTLELRNQLLQRQNAELPSLPRGYEWRGPYLYSETPSPQTESDHFSFREPLRSEGIGLAYEWPKGDGLSIAERIATKVLSERGVPT